MNFERQLKWQNLETQITACRKCERLVAWREYIAQTRKKAYHEWEYWGKPVPGFGDYDGKVLAVGLAPGAHGSNRTGRMFTGDSSGNFLYRMLYNTGFSNQPDSTWSGDGLLINDLYISAVCRCAPPQNKPLPSEIKTCIHFLEQEVALLNNVRVIVALGRIAFDQVIKLASVCTGNQYKYQFKHGNCYEIRDGFPYLIASYHPSRQNTQTGRLTEAMFEEIWVSVRRILDRPSLIKRKG
jgi:uracil-DNA glycosylase